MVTVGEIRGVYGVKGWVKLFSWTSPRENLLNYQQFSDTAGRVWQLREARVQGKALIGKFDGVDDRDQAAALNGTLLQVARDALPETAAGEFYWADLEGCTVEDEQGRRLGEIDYLIETGANDVLVVRGESGEVLVPFVMDRVILDVDIAARRVRVSWPPETV